MIRYCLHCGKLMDVTDASERYCSDYCRQFKTNKEQQENKIKIWLQNAVILLEENDYDRTTILRELGMTPDDYDTFILEK